MALYKKTNHTMFQNRTYAVTVLPKQYSFHEVIYETYNILQHQ